MGNRIADVPERDRPRERLERLGPAALTDAELLALVLRSGGRGASVLDVATGVISAAGGIRSLASADVETLVGHAAMGVAKACGVAAAFELGRRAAANGQSDCETVRGPADVAAIARRELTDPAREGLVLLVMNQRNRLIRVKRLTTGTDTRCLLDSRDVLRAVVASRGTAFAVAHNHPGGRSLPSDDDVRSTDLLATAAQAIGVQFLDHVIISSEGWRSVPRTDPAD